MGPIQLNIFISGLDSGTECTVSKFADKTELGREAGTSEECAAVQKNLDRQEK